MVAELHGRRSKGSGRACGRQREDVDSHEDRKGKERSSGGNDEGEDAHLVFPFIGAEGNGRRGLVQRDLWQRLRNLVELCAHGGKQAKWMRRITGDIMCALAQEKGKEIAVLTSLRRVVMAAEKEEEGRRKKTLTGGVGL